MTPALRVQALRAGYGRAGRVISGVSLVVPPAGLIAVLGPTGSGKSTLLHAVAGVVPDVQGEVWLAGERIDGLPADERARRGLVLVPERDSVFARLTARQNLRLAVRDGADGWEAEATGVFPELGPLLDRTGAALSGGERRMVALARALLARPRVLLVDAPTLGLAPEVSERLTRALRRAQSGGTAVVVAQQRPNDLVAAADACYVLSSGRVAAVVEPGELQRGGLGAEQGPGGRG